MVVNTSIMRQFTKFHKIIDDLKSIEVKIGDEDKNLLLLSSLPKSFEHVKYVHLYGKRVDDNMSCDVLVLNSFTFKYFYC